MSHGTIFPMTIFNTKSPKTFVALEIIAKYIVLFCFFCNQRHNAFSNIYKIFATFYKKNCIWSRFHSEGCIYIFTTVGRQWLFYRKLLLSGRKLATAWSIVEREASASKERRLRRKRGACIKREAPATRERRLQQERGACIKREVPASRERCLHQERGACVKREAPASYSVNETKWRSFHSDKGVAFKMTVSYHSGLIKYRTPAVGDWLYFSFLFAILQGFILPLNLKWHALKV